MVEISGFDAKVNDYSTSFIGKGNDRRLLKVEGLAISPGGSLQMLLVGSFGFLSLCGIVFNKY